MMPVYDYRCEWGHEFERTQSITDEPLRNCPVLVDGPDGGEEEFPCGGPVERLIAKGTSFILEGGGWAKDGYG